MSEKTKYTHTIKQLFEFVKPYRNLFVFVALISILLSGLGVLRTYFFKVIIDDFIVPKDYQGMVEIIWIMLGLLFAEVISQVSFMYYTSWLGQYIIRDIRNKLFGYMIRFKMKYYDQSSVGILVTRAVNDIERIAEIFSSGLFEIFSEILKMLVVMGVMIYFDWRLALIVFATLPIILYATNWFQKSMKVAFTEVRKQVAELNSFVQERLSGMKIIQLFTRENYEYQKFEKINKKHEKAWLANIWYNSIFFPISDLVTSVAMGLIVWYGGLQAVNNTGIQLGTILMFIQLIQRLFQPLRHIADKFNTLQMGVIAAQRVFAIIETHRQYTEIEGNNELSEVQGNIRFENVRFGYKENEEILHGINFSVEKGQTVAIVGATGAGKSTIINLINRFYDLNGGTILIDNQDIRDFTLISLRKHIAIVLQDVFLFADTILNNITLRNPSISKEEVIQAAKEIGIHKFIKKLPQGYEYNVKERGATLSAGQRQLIAFLRAYVHKPEILILDEATSSVDSHSEKLIKKATERITKGRTSIIIAHRLATIQQADKIIVLDKGNIVEEGTHDKLLTIPNGYYRNLQQVATNLYEDKI
ncbi:ABC transporter ATP-binding protein [Capnocytophaga catalasegens]|uniref:Xenobiotic ABC transporter ATP-binding protein n=1 Tax=Capnocytophaga catalasegens TaxID=1004260 RepID=A0AAV5AUA9_9FLAO|nr:ABC transporter ATP-binding protein [Capnocytophaga catalasegens]GIZ15366.1 xenobiotic ABC transporter ATP-binding protein [Capnocytophaga catalasegens]GJM50954.1 xenobiotic ABC transporter ATP-binding protein [Capnocytophaga catalasegens]GJM52138.1 xenobiotic ABC transporter ATP-binding protein [Capnocytophaga catalasegens]